jgi:hypothetical protein
LRKVASGDPAAVTFGVVITTIGRWDNIASLFEDLAKQSTPPHTVALAYEDRPDAVEGLSTVLQRYSDKLTIRAIAKTGGGSIGCNKAAAMLTDDVEWMCFLTDRCRVDPDYLERLSEHCVAPTTVCALQLSDAEGDRNKLPPRGSAFTRRNAWSAVVPAMAVKRRDYEEVGGFDPLIGTGADSPWQSGDETDLLLRLSLLDDFSIDWVQDITVRVHTDFTHLPPAERRRKLRGYGRGTGYIYRRWNYSLFDQLLHLAGAASGPLRNHAKYRVRDALALLIGRTEGLLGRTFSTGSDHRAVLR